MGASTTSCADVRAALIASSARDASALARTIHEFPAKGVANPCGTKFSIHTQERSRAFGRELALLRERSAHKGVLRSSSFAIAVFELDSGELRLLSSKRRSVVGSSAAARAEQPPVAVICERHTTGSGACTRTGGPIAGRRRGAVDAQHAS